MTRVSFGSVTSTTFGDVADIDRPAVARGQQQVADFGQRLQRLAGDQRRAAGRPSRTSPGLEGAVGALDLGGELLQRDAVEREPLGVGLDPDLLRLLADDVGQADVGELGHLDLQLAGEPRQAVRASSARPPPASA